MIGGNREIHDAKSLADFRRQADALTKYVERDAKSLADFRRQFDTLANYVERMEESARKRALRRSVASMLILLDAVNRRYDFDISER
jgi:hypothetical protein